MTHPRFGMQIVLEEEDLTDRRGKGVENVTETFRVAAYEMQVKMKGLEIQICLDLKGSNRGGARPI